MKSSSRSSRYVLMFPYSHTNTNESLCSTHFCHSISEPAISRSTFRSTLTDCIRPQRLHTTHWRGQANEAILKSLDPCDENIEISVELGLRNIALEREIAILTTTLTTDAPSPSPSPSGVGSPAPELPPRTVSGAAPAAANQLRIQVRHSALYAVATAPPVCTHAVLMRVDFSMEIAPYTFQKHQCSPGSFLPSEARTEASHCRAWGVSFCSAVTRPSGVYSITPMSPGMNLRRCVGLLSEPICQTPTSTLRSQVGSRRHSSTCSTETIWLDTTWPSSRRLES